jgi:hypothetical protein
MIHRRVSREVTSITSVRDLPLDLKGQSRVLNALAAGHSTRITHGLLQQRRELQEIYIANPARQRGFLKRAVV